jgi:hypothetical protein
MPSPADLPLSELAQRLARKQLELEKARQAYESRLADLNRRKAQLQAQLGTVTAEIQAVNSTITLGTASASVSTPAPGAVPGEPPVAPAKSTLTLPALLLDLVRAAGGPITVKELTEGVVRAKFHSTSQNLGKMIKNKVAGLVKRGVLRRAAGQPGVVLGRPQPGKQIAAAKGARGKTARRNGKTVTAARSTKPAGKPAVSLRSLLARFLAESRQPMTARELAAKALAVGYPTESKDFIRVVWDALGKIPGVESLPGEGYRLKRPGKKK